MARRVFASFVWGMRRTATGDLYGKIKEDEMFRRMEAERRGFGFEIPSVVLKVTKKEIRMPLWNVA